MGLLYLFIKFNEVEFPHMRGNHVRGFEVVKCSYVIKRKNERIFATFSHESAKKKVPKFGRYLHIGAQNLQVQRSAR